MAPPITAKPQGFVLKMRLVSPKGTPFANRDYRVEWNGKTLPAPPASPRRGTKPRSGAGARVTGPPERPGA